MHDNILDNLDKYTAEQLAAYIRQGVVTLDELRQEGLAVNVRHEIETLLENDPEEDDWQHACDLNTVEAYQDYLSNYPEGNFRSDARRKIQSLQEVETVQKRDDDDESVYSSVDKNSIQALDEFIRNNPSNRFRIEARRRKNELSRKNRLSGVERVQRVILQSDPYDIPGKIENLIVSQEATEEDVIEIFRNNHNILPVDIVKMLDGVIDFRSLTEAGIDDLFIDQLEDFDSVPPSELDKIDLDKVPPLRSIPDGFTEIYFWGVPASGKTCAVGSIMSTMTNGRGVKSVMPFTDSQGSLYMMPLASSFREDKVCILPPRTKVEETFEMRYQITDDDNKEHGLAFIDLSGELFECMHLSRAHGKENLSPKQQRALNVLEDILVNNRSKNPKIHFFVIEYGSENNRYKGLSQNELLLSCLNYLDDKSILKDNTIGSYLIITKADKAGDANIGEYIDEHYNGFYTGLTQRMTKWGINTRKGKSQVKRFPFSIGDVCFQKWCIYDPEWTQWIIEEIKNRSYGIETGLIGKFKSATRK